MKYTRSADPRAILWWRILCALAIVNVSAWIVVFRHGPRADSYGTWQLALSAVYVVVCAYRSVLPRVDLERLVVFDTTLSSIALGRLAATIAEICFGLQLGWFANQLGANAGLTWVQDAAWVIPVLTAGAQLFCWHSILTLNHATQAVESLLWGAAFSWMAVLLAAVARVGDGTTRTIAAAGIACSIAFVAYVLAVDVPMYLRRYRDGRAAGREYLGLMRGVRDAWSRRVQSHSWASWKGDALWLTPYFSAGVWISMALVFLPR